MTLKVHLSETASLAYDAVSSGVPLIALHGAYSARGEVRGFLEPMIHTRLVRRVYIDLPGHADSRPSSGVGDQMTCWAPSTGCVRQGGVRIG